MEEESSMMTSELLDLAMPEHSLILDFLYVSQWVPFICFSSCVLNFFCPSESFFHTLVTGGFLIFPSSDFHLRQVRFNQTSLGMLPRGLMIYRQNPSSLTNS